MFLYHLHVKLPISIYVQKQPLNLQLLQDSGQNGHNVVWSAYEDEKVTISGGTTLSEWTKVDFIFLFLSISFTILS